MLQPKKNNSGLNDDDHAILVKELTNYANDGASDEDLKVFRDTFIAQKKKSASSSPKPNSESSGTAVSSGTSRDNRPLNSPSKYPVGSMAWNQEKLKQNVKGYTSVYDKFKSAESVHPDKINEIKQSVDAEANDEGLWNNIVKLGKQAVNATTDYVFKMTDEGKAPEDLKLDVDPLAKEKAEAKKLLVKQAQIAKAKKEPAPEITPDAILGKAKEIAVNKRVKSQRDSQVREFVSSLPETQKDNLTRFSVGELSTIKEDQNVILKKQNVLNDEIDYSLAKIQELNTKAKSLKAKGEELPDDLQKEFQVEHSKYQSLLGDAIKNQNEFISKEGDIGDFTDNIDVFKRNYGALNNVFTNIHATAQELSAGVVGAFDYGLQVKSKFLGKNGTDMIMSDFIGDVSNALNKSAADKRSEVERPVSVENINTAHDFGHWFFSDVIANQVPVYALVATGAGGIGAIGASAAGNKFEQMQGEQASGEMKYTDAQMFGVPLGYGIAETASAAVDGIILKNAGRVIKSATSSERKTMAQGLWNAVKQSSKGAAMEGLDESATQVAENLLDRYSGKKVRLLDGVKDAGSAGAIMGAFLPISSHVVAAGLKPFLTTNNIQRATAEIANYEKQLQNTEISETSRKVIEKQLEAAKAKVNTELSEKIEDVKKLSDRQFTEIGKIQKEKAAIKSDAKEIALDDNLDDDTKDQLTKSLKSEYNEREQRRVDILERSGYKEFNKLDDEQQIKLKDQAARQLMKEENPDGTKNVTFDDEQITKKAVEIYKDKQIKEESKETVAHENAETPTQEKNEEIQGENIAANDGVRPMPSVLGESGTAVEDSAGKKTLPESVDGGGIEEKVKSPITNNENTSFYTGRKTKISDFSKTKGDFVFFSKNKNVSEWYGGDESNVTESNIDTSNFLDLSTQNKKAEFVRDNFTEEDVKKLYAKQIDHLRFEKEKQQLIKNKLLELQENRFSGDGEIQNLLLNKIKNKGYSGVALNDSFFGKEDMSYVVIDKSVIKEVNEKAKFALDNIEKGVTLWSGNISDPRVDLGIAWTDIRKGELDIKKGNYNTIPAKRLIEAMDKARQEGGFRYKEGTGGKFARNSQFVPLEEMQKLSNEYSLTDAELEQANNEQEQLSTEYDNYFNALDVESQNEILSYYEGEQIKSAEVSGDSENRESQIDAQNQEAASPIESRKEKRIKTTEAKIDDLANALKDLLPSVPNTDGLKKQGLSQDQIIDFIADSAKMLASATITVDEAIRQVVEHLKSKGFDVDVDLEAVKQKLEDTQSREVSKEIKSNESLDKLLANIPKSAEVKQYLSGETIEKYEGEKPSNDQDYLKQELYPALEHGVKILDKFKEDFGDQYIDKVLSYLDGNNVPVEAKALLYVTLENDLATRKKSEIDNELQISKLQDLVRAKSQRHLRAASLAINFGRLRQFAQSGYDLSKVTNQLFSSEELEGRSKIEKAVQASADEINNEAEVIEQGQIDDYVEKAIQEGVSKQIDEIYKRLPSSRKIKADKTIKALEKVQKNLRSKTYDASIGIPVAIIDSGITVIKNSIKAGVNIADAIEYGIEHIKEKYGKEWANENAFRKDMHEGLKSEGVDMTSEEKTKAAQAKQLVKDALIERGFGREITVTKKEVDADGNVNRVKEKRNIVDWKKLAGEEGSIDRIRKNVESALEEKGYSESEVNAIKDDLEQEYNNIRASVIEKSINELVNRNTPRKPVDVKTSAKRLAELYNYGLFEKESDTYDHLLNNAVGLNSIGQKAFNDAKLLAKSLADLYSTNVDGRKVNEFGIKHAVRVINKQIEDLLTKVAWEQSNKVYKSSTVVKEYVGLSQRMMLNSVKQLVENPLSGAIQRVFTNIGFVNEKTDSKELSKNRSEIARNIYEDTVRNGGLSYGDITTPLVSKSKIEDYLNGKADTKTKQTLLSYAMGRTYLEGADSMHKSALTERYFSHNLIKILSDKSNPNKMSREDAVKYVSEQLTGQSFEDAKNTAQQIIEKANKDAGKVVLPNNKESVNRLAQDIVKDALINGKKITIDEIEASYKAAYKAAGFDLGHEANNPISKGVGNLSAKVEYNIEKAIKEKKWNEAAAYTFESILTRNILNPFVGGGTNWVVLTLQKTGVDFVSPLVNYAKARDNRLDLSTDAGMKNLENALLQSLKYKNSMTRFTVGAMASFVIAASAIASGADDDLEDWLKKNEWARRYFNVVAPQTLTALLAAKDEKMGKYFSQLLGIRSGEMDEGVKLTTAVKNYSSGNIDDALGTTGDLTGSRLSAPVPFRFVKDAQNIVRGFLGKPQIKVEFQTKGFWNGYFKGGLFEYMGLRPETSNSFQNPKAKELQEKYIKLNSMKDSFAKNKLKQEIDKLEKKLFEEADKKRKE